MCDTVSMSVSSQSHVRRKRQLVSYPHGPVLTMMLVTVESVEADWRTYHLGRSEIPTWFMITFVTNKSLLRDQQLGRRTG